MAVLSMFLYVLFKFSIKKGERASINYPVIIGYKGKVNWDSSFPNGTPRKKLDSTRFTKVGWKPSVSLEKGIIDTYDEYKLSLGEI